AKDENKPLLSKLLAAPSLRAHYLGYVREMATKWLDWNRLGPVAEQYHNLIAEDVKADTRKLDSMEAFLSSPPGWAPVDRVFRRGPRTTDLRNLAEKRRAFLLNHSAIKSEGGVAGGGSVKP